LISRETIGNILSVIKIEEVIGEFVNLKRRGVNYLGLCPFHNEKTPSFNVSPTKGIYKCFGCGKAGTAISFLMEHEHFSYPEALQFLAKKYNVEIDEEEQTAEQIQEQNERESLFKLNEFAKGYFTRTLFENEEGKAVGLTYFRERGFRDETIWKFQLGYSVENRETFSRHAQKEGYKPDYLVKTGLSVQKEDSLFDRFHGRVIFPIHSASGRVIGFGARILTKDKAIAKYLNSPESEIYNKSKSLYGIYFARNAIVSKNNCYLVEGYTDVISLHQAGIENVVASSGTSLTQDQVKLIKRYTPNITILYDGDPAGIKASMRGIDMILEEGMNVKIVLFPEGDDPDSFARKNRSADVEHFIVTNAVNFILFKTKLLLEETAGDPIRKADLIREIVNTISLIPDGISRSLYIQECSSLLDVSEQSLYNLLNRILRKKHSKHNKEEEPIQYIEESPKIKAPTQFIYDSDSIDYQEEEVIRLLLLYGNQILIFKILDEDKIEKTISVTVADFIVNDISNDDIKFENSNYQNIFNEISQSLNEGNMIGSEYFWTHPDKNISDLTIDICFFPHELSQNWQKNHVYTLDENERLDILIPNAIFIFKAKKIDKLIIEKQKVLKEKLSDSDVNDILKELKELKTISNNVHEKLGRIVIR
jgi:DNA primase